MLRSSGITLLVAASLAVAAKNSTLLQKRQEAAFTAPIFTKINSYSYVGCYDLSSTGSTYFELGTYTSADECILACATTRGGGAWPSCIVENGVCSGSPFDPTSDGTFGDLALSRSGCNAPCDGAGWQACGGPGDGSYGLLYTSVAVPTSSPASSASALSAVSTAGASSAVVSPSDVSSAVSDISSTISASDASSTLSASEAVSSVLSAADVSSTASATGDVSSVVSATTDASSVVSTASASPTASSVEASVSGSASSPSVLQQVGDYTYAGCWKRHGNMANPALVPVSVSDSDFTASACLEACATLNAELCFFLPGFCGSSTSTIAEYAPTDSTWPDSMCNYPCPGDASEACGYYNDEMLEFGSLFYSRTAVPAGSPGSASAVVSASASASGAEASTVSTSTTADAASTLSGDASSATSNIDSSSSVVVSASGVSTVVSDASSTSSAAGAEASAVDPTIVRQLGSYVYSGCWDPDTMNVGFIALGYKGSVDACLGVCLSAAACYTDQDGNCFVTVASSWSNGAAQYDDDSCTAACPGSPSEVCGGGRRGVFYTVGTPAASTVVSSIPTSSISASAESSSTVSASDAASAISASAVEGTSSTVSGISTLSSIVSAASSTASASAAETSASAAPASTPAIASVIGDYTYGGCYSGQGEPKGIEFLGTSSTAAECIEACGEALTCIVILGTCFSSTGTSADYAAAVGSSWPDSTCTEPCTGDATQACGREVDGFGALFYTRTDAGVTSSAAVSSSAIASASASDAASSLSPTDVSSASPIVSASDASSVVVSTSEASSVVSDASSTLSSDSSSAVSASASASAAPSGPTKADLEGWSYAGCFSDLRHARSVENHIATSPWTAETCLTAAQAAGYQVAGLIYGGECWGAYSVASTAVALDADQCKWKCNNDENTYCGGESALDVYVLESATKFVADKEWSYTGCYTDSISARTLPHGLGSQHWDIQTCLDLAAAAEYKYAGIIYGGECWGANEIASTGTVQSLSKCNWDCNDARGVETCGGEAGLDVYQVRSTVAPTKRQRVRRWGW
ncbi:hypothetical protein JCM8547_003577 [Rhodosporidiobolus lusitaniae]